MLSSVTAPVDMVDEETPQSMDHGEDYHGKELKEGEDVGFCPHVLYCVN
jgi:hypothetical protein